MKTMTSKNFKTFFALVLTIGFIAASIAQVSSATPISAKTTNVGSTSISITVTSSSDSRAYLEYGTSKTKYSGKTSAVNVPKGGSVLISIDGLKESTKYYFRVRYAIGNKATFSALTQMSATTSKTGEDYVFAIQADPHMDQASSADVYRATLNQVVKAKPAFMMDLGDIFMTDKLPNKSDTEIRARFQMMKDFYGILGNIPYYFTLGNHDGELGYSNFNTKKYRKEYFPDQTPELAYYSFTSPNSLHVVLDIFTYTTSNPKDDGWQWTLGKTQYDWLKATLESSKATHKFIYVHHLLYGNAQSRGGSEKAKYNEWGGLNQDGSNGFTSNRPGWEMPVHQLLVKNGVDFVFKGHDHIYVKQELDGIIYQTLPQPSHPGEKTSSASEYGYVGGKTIGGSGFLKLTTTSTSIKVEFIKHDGTILDSYVKSA